MNLVSSSKFLSLILRHEPEKIGVEMDDEGWVLVDQLLEKTNASGKKLSRSLLELIVQENNKKRFTFSKDGKYIRASQGHSVKVNTLDAPQTPPPILYHGTATRFLETILKEGLKPMNRLHVHLSSDLNTATKVGQRHGKPIILKVKASTMSDAGQVFWLSKNGVWLTGAISADYLSILNK